MTLTPWIYLHPKVCYEGTSTLCTLTGQLYTTRSIYSAMSLTISFEFLRFKGTKNTAL